MKQNICELYIGIETRVNKAFSVDGLLDEVKKVFIERKIDFSATKQSGGYLSPDGTYVLENSIKITIVGEISEKKMTNFIKEVKRIFKQESILYVRRELDYEFVRN